MPPEATPMMAAATAVVLFILTASCGCWTVASLRAAIHWRLLPEGLLPVAAQLVHSFGVKPHLPLVAWNPRRPVPWAIIDLVALVAVYIFGSLGIALALRQLGWLGPRGEFDDLTLGQRQTLTLANVCISLLVMALCMPMLSLRSGAKNRDFGWSLAELGRDLRLGFIGFVMLAPPVYAIQGVLVYIWKPSKHPLMEMFRDSPDAMFFATLVLAAVVVAPLFEEFVFRVLLQGWLEKLCTFRGDLPELLFGAKAAAVLPATQSAEVVAPVVTASIHDSSNPYASPAPDESTLSIDGLSPHTADQPELRGWRAWVPIAVSSLIFALLHYDHGPDWVPLTLLAAGMGYLYQRTHRLVPSLTVHVLLNGLSMWGLWIQVYEMNGAGL